jgi:hypothetical protein
MKAVAGLTIALLVTAGVSAQTPARDRPTIAVTGTAAIDGTVIADDERRAPLRRAYVTLSRTGIEDIRRSATDDLGRFIFTALPAGTYTLSVSKGGYVGRSFGALQPGMPGSTITVVDGQRFLASPIALMRGAVIAGRLLDRHGRPVANRSVEATQFVRVDGEYRRRRVSGASGIAVTNGHGEYRIYGLLPGEYVVYSTTATPSAVRDVTTEEIAWAQDPSAAAPVPGRSFSYAPTAFPGTTDPADATAIALKKGEERDGVDFRLQHVLVSRVRGVLTGVDGLPVAGATIWRIARRQSLIGFDGDVQVSRSATDGSFSFAGVPPGDFVISARLEPSSDPAPEPRRAQATEAAAGLWASTDLRVNGQDLDDVALRFQPGMTMSGRVIFKGAAPASFDIKSVRLRLSPLDAAAALGLGAQVTTNVNGTFTLPAIVPGTYRMQVTVPAGAGLFARSAMIAGTDALDVPFVIRPNEDVSDVVVTLSDQPAELSGRLVDGAGQPTPQFYVFAFPTDKTAWVDGVRRIASVRADVNGRYALSPLVPGEYYLCALTEFEAALQYDPSYLEQLVPASIKITIGEGEKRVQDLRVGGGMW